MCSALGPAARTHSCLGLVTLLGMATTALVPMAIVLAKVAAPMVLAAPMALVLLSGITLTEASTPGRREAQPTV